MPFWPRQFKNFVKNQRGNVAIFAALGASVVFGTVGMAVDYSRARELSATLDAASDAAALAAAASADEYEKAGKTGIPAKARADALATWKLNVDKVKSDLSGSPKITVSKSLGAWTAKVTYAGNLQTSLMNIIGISNIPVRAEAVATTASSTAAARRYWDLTMLVDNSGSMGIGATQADMDLMQANTSCMFACHYDPSFGPSMTMSDTAAAGYGARLRIDIVDDAIDAMVAKFDTLSTRLNLRAALYGLNIDAVPLVSMTSNLPSVSAHDLRLSIAPLGGSQGDTDLHKSMTTIASTIGTAGDGGTAVRSKKVLFIVSDGLHDTPYASTDTTPVAGQVAHQVGVIDPAQCEAIKAKGVKIAVLYIDYIDPAGFEMYVDPVRAKFLPNMQACASPNLFMNATSPQGIEDAMLDLLDGVMSGNGVSSDVRLTQ